MNALIQFIMKLLGMGGAGGLDKIFKDVIMKQAGGGAGGSPLDILMNQFKDKGLGNIFQSWVGTGPNQLISPQQVQDGIGPAYMAEMAKKANVPEPVLAEKLSKYLPGIIDKMTPDGQLPKG